MPSIIDPIKRPHKPHLRYRVEEMLSILDACILEDKDPPPLGMGVRQYVNRVENLCELAAIPFTNELPISFHEDVCDLYTPILPFWGVAYAAAEYDFRIQGGAYYEEWGNCVVGLTYFDRKELTTEEDARRSRFYLNYARAIRFADQINWSTHFDRISEWGMDYARIVLQRGTRHGFEREESWLRLPRVVAKCIQDSYENILEGKYEELPPKPWESLKKRGQVETTAE